jgi:hypothetical protein
MWVHNEHRWIKQDILIQTLSFLKLSSCSYSPATYWQEKDPLREVHHEHPSLNSDEDYSPGNWYHVRYLLHYVCQRLGEENIDD